MRPPFLYANTSRAWCYVSLDFIQLDPSRIDFVGDVDITSQATSALFSFLFRDLSTCAFPTAPRQLRGIMCSSLDTLCHLEISVYARVDEMRADVIVTSGL